MKTVKFVKNITLFCEVDVDAKTDEEAIKMASEGDFHRYFEVARSEGDPSDFELVTD